MDLTSYWQIDVNERDREKTDQEKTDQERPAFIIPDDLLEFKVMPCGLCLSPATFQRIIQYEPA